MTVRTARAFSRDSLAELVGLLQDPQKFLQAIDVFEDRRIKADAAEEAAARTLREADAKLRELEVTADALDRRERAVSLAEAKLAADRARLREIVREANAAS